MFKNLGSTISENLLIEGRRLALTMLQSSGQYGRVHVIVSRGC